MNDINIWDSSKLHNSLHNGSFERSDFPFKVSGKTFHKLCFLNIVVLTLNYLTLARQSGSLWKNGTHFIQYGKGQIGRIQNDVLVCSWRSLIFQIQFQNSFIELISEIVYCSFILHKMAVEKCIISEDEISGSADSYNVINNEETIMQRKEPAGIIAALAFIKGVEDVLSVWQ